HFAVGVDAASAVGACVVVVAEDVVLDETGVGGAVVGKKQPRDVVLNEVVQHSSAMLPRADDEARLPHVVGLGVALDGEAVEGDVVGLDEKSGAAAGAGVVAVADRLGAGL